ncbi:MAG: type II toxin-antitoxin system PemK/MazF family toxin [Chlamydiae bacterium]|nr:type II toxin-antitoxin system PemK/MazF family toxin [Chlamydiota bacterium]
MSLSRGDVVLLSFPFTDLSSQKVRPAVVLSRESYNNKGEDIIVCSVTSNINRQGLFNIKIDDSHPEFSISGFKLPSAIIVDKIHSLHNSLVKRKLGSLGQKTLSKIEKILKEILFS